MKAHNVPEQRERCEHTCSKCDESTYQYGGDQACPDTEYETRGVQWRGPPGCILQPSGTVLHRGFLTDTRLRAQDTASGTACKAGCVVADAGWVLTRTISAARRGHRQLRTSERTLMAPPGAWHRGQRPSPGERHKMVDGNVDRTPPKDDDGYWPNGGPGRHQALAESDMGWIGLSECAWSASRRGRSSSGIHACSHQT